MIPTVSVEQMREVDRLIIDELHIELVQMMENAGRAFAEQARQLVGGDVHGARVVVLAGPGGNGGGGLAAARRLSIWRAAVVVVLGAARHQFQGVPLHQLTILDRIGVQVRDAEPGRAVVPALDAADLVLDALIGYSLHGPSREPSATLIRAANASGALRLALDIPSGLDGNSGEAYDPTVRAVSTLTLALPKVGLTRPAAREWVGSLHVADISVSQVVYDRLGLDVGALFARSDIVPVPLDEYLQ